ncbi:MAG TPA: TauD/TfdA family dioxygenase [Candidatus Dormibacteraeota bacterium]|nr:TauD/TfdA family dioxygenase [Candidatus Dormibacteraeota bacterium]
MNTYRTSIASPEGLPLCIEPTDDTDVGHLCDWLRDNADWVQERLTAHGALLFRGFPIFDAPTFERVARAVDEHLKNEYLGTSPRNGLTDHVFTASELPPFFPIPEHCEMSFVAHPPERVFFCCLLPPAPNTGETPLVDFRAVWRDLDPDIRQRFENGGIRIVRNYAGPGGGSKLDLWQLKRWDEMFLTTDKAAVEAKCREEGFEVQWGPKDSLCLISTQPVHRDHPRTGERVWHNHTQVFHLSAAPGEYRRIAALRPTLRNRVLAKVAELMVAVQRRLRASDQQAMHCTYLDGREIADADMEHVRDVIWRHLVITPWQRGDVLAIDNHSVAHGRLPYNGPRQVAVAWA